ncbi:MAG: sensor histidine kinase, partial [Balneolaceae bacterium]
AQKPTLKPLSYIYADQDKDGNPDHLGEIVTVTGIANMKSGLFHSKFLQAFIQNDSAGLSIFSQNLSQSFSRGDSLIVTGKIQQYLGLTELYVISYRVVKGDRLKVPRPNPLSKAVEYPLKFIGTLVHGSGVITGKGTTQNGKYLIVSMPDSTKRSVLVYISNFHVLFSDFKFDVLNVGDDISVTGIMGEKSPSFPDRDLHKIYVRTPEDLAYEGIPRYYLLLGLGILFLVSAVVAVWIVSLRREVKNKTAEIQQSLHEKEVLLREIHHRVKNNLSIISGLIELQLDGTQDGKARQVLKDSQSRIYSMAMIHEKLYETESLSSIRLDTYLRELVEAIHGTFMEYSNSVSLEFDMDAASLVIDKIVPCGLLINELVVNAFKHAFTENGKGILRIGLQRENGFARLTIADNGPGLPEDFTLEDTGSLGSMLIRTFAAQLEARTSIENRDGAKFTFTFSIT